MTDALREADFNTTTRHAPSTCPACGYVMDSTSGSRKPEPSDISVCMRCATALTFDDGLRLRALTVGELAAVEPRLQEQIETIARAIRRVRAWTRGTTR